MRRVLITGATGFIGNELIDFLLENKFKINILSRYQLNAEKEVNFYQWDIERGHIDLKAFEEVDTIINLVGANISERSWSNARKKELIDSRVKSLDLLYKTIKENELDIAQLISSSAVGYYGAVTNEHIYTEGDAPGTDFLGSVCEQWEQAALKFNTLGVKVNILRKGVVVGSGGMYEKMTPLAKNGINPALGSGRQYLPWISIDDLKHLYLYILNNLDLEGVYNSVTQSDITMNDFSKALLASFNKRKRTPNVPSFIIKIMFGEMSNMLLKGSRVSNQKLLNEGFKFQDTHIQKVFEHLRNID